MRPITDVREISRIAYGFMASKALFAALELDLFGRLSGTEKSLDELVRDTGVRENRLAILLTTLAALGLLERSGDRYRNAPASERYLVHGALQDFSEYYRYQISRQIYPAMAELERVMRGEAVAGLYDAVAGDERFAEAFSRGQHAGSLGPAHLLSRAIDLDGRRRLLDVGGGSGAFSIMLCRRFPDLKCTILDFPNVLKVADHYVREAGFSERIALRPGNVLRADWPGGQDVVLLSYICSAIGEHDIDVVITKAYGSLAPGGLLLVHDFMVDDADFTGPVLAAQWSLVSLLSNPEAISLTPAYFKNLARDAGFASATSRELIPEITTLVVCERS